MNPIGIAVIAGVTILLIAVWVVRVWLPFQQRCRRNRYLLERSAHHSRAAENEKFGSVVADIRGVKIRNGRDELLELAWDEVEAVHAYKKDLMTRDLVCVAFKHAGRNEYFEMHEEMAGYHELLDRLTHHLPGFTLEWFPAVAYPAFKINHRIVWQAAASSTPPGPITARPAAPIESLKV